MKSSLISLVIFIFCVISNNANAQNKQRTAYEKQRTAYEKKQLELSKKWFQTLSGNTMSMSDELFYEELASGKEASEFFLGLVAFNYASTHSKAQCEIVFRQMANEFKQAELLKNAIDFQREKELKLKKEQLEKEAKLKRSKDAYLRTNKGRSLNNIADSFQKWNEKGEFEKEFDFVERINTQSKKEFDKICLDNLKKEIQSVNYNLEYNLKKELSVYNSEKEYFTISFKFNEIIWQNEFNIPIKEAIEFKENWNNLSVHVGNYDWCLSGNSFCPTIITLKTRNNYYNTEKPKKEYTFPVNQKNRSEIVIVFDDFGIQNNNLKGHIFKFSNAKNIEEAFIKETIKLDSLELINLNQRLDTTFQHYNRKLLQNPYNVERKVIENFSKIEIDLQAGYNGKVSEFRQNKFNQYKNDIERMFNHMNDDFEQKLKYSNVSSYCAIYFTQNPDKKIEADKLFIECKCNYPKRINFDIKFIEGNIFKCDCREKQFEKNKELFSNKEEFDGFYNQGNEILQKEIETRILKKEEERATSEITKDLSKIENLDFKDAKIKSFGHNLVNYYFRMVENHKQKPYYSKILDIFIENNKSLKKEWVKKGSLFSDKTEFYESYTSGKYKEDLKQKKK